MTNLDMLLLKGPSGNVEDGLNELRYTILTQGIPANNEGMSELRMYIWLILLNAPPIRTDIYLDLVRQGASPAHSKIQNDAFRTFPSDPLFRRRVTQNSITRVLNAVAWRLNDAHEARVNGWQSPPTLSEFGGSPDNATTTSRASLGAHTMSNTASSVVSGSTATGTANDAEQIGYVQGMNVLCGPFLYVARSEVEAFTGFENLITRECPGYVRGAMDGVHKGVALVDRVLEAVDPKLYAHLLEKNLPAKLWAFAPVLTLSACTPPLLEVLRLWDFLFAYGAHLNVLCIVAQLVLIRGSILDSKNPGPLVQKPPPLNAERIISVATSFASKIPEDLYEDIIHHAR
ncbi:unnamed protein product [Periconia digitata]|uniref:Rab-GAP TBC domain-containing protein n=1 Tax=Periconia digitata TaxID=1303443 RepID=A0A9W4UB94_9PLEO|nr:unnamed protein product [Periconia digitata]